MKHEQDTDSFVYRYIAHVINNSPYIDNEIFKECIKDAFYFTSHVLDDSFIIPNIDLKEEAIIFSWKASNGSSIKIRFLGNDRISFVALSDLEKPIPHSTYAEISIDNLFDLIPAAWYHVGYVWKKAGCIDYSKYAHKQTFYYPEMRLICDYDIKPLTNGSYRHVT